MTQLSITTNGKLENDAYNPEQTVYVCTDGSCHPPTGTGAWAAIVLKGEEKTYLSGTAVETTHQIMELTAAVESIKHIEQQGCGDAAIVVYTDSQYLAGLGERRRKLLLKAAAGETRLRNSALVLSLLELLGRLPLSFIKVPAHGKATGSINYNREVDMLSRKIVRTIIRK